ncbi:MAG: hypothetical protein MUF48_14440 [Pirellulaceae bacterium]|jgi:hypothetical protein|nr:hypothetical protein [Pirellulaceae bacterium]
MSVTVGESQLRDFARSLLEHTGGIVDWPHDQRTGLVLAPVEVARCLGQTDESFRVALSGTEGDLSLDLGGEFLDRAACTLATYVPAQGAFALPGLNVKKSEFARTVEQAFGWQNARCQVCQGNAMLIVYHTWWFHVALRSDDVWESLLAVTINCDGQTVCRMDGLLEAMEQRPVPGLSRAPDTTIRTAATCAQEQVLQDARTFLDRMDNRVERDRQRLRDYYRALLREAATPSRRVKTVPGPEELAARQRAVKLELQRKLAELAERFAIDGLLRPVALAEFHVPGVVIDVRIQRKAAKREFRLYWNAVQKRIEPMQCSRCGRGSYNLWFTNETVEPVCNACHDQADTGGGSSRAGDGEKLA